jgi:hypothetical protein
MKACHHAPTCAIKILPDERKDMKGKSPSEGERPVEGVLPVVAPEPGLLGVAQPVVAPEPLWQGVPKARKTPYETPKEANDLYTRIPLVQRRRRGHGHPKTEPVGGPLKKTSRIHDPSTIEQRKGKKQEYDPPQPIEEDRTLVNPE